MPAGKFGWAVAQMGLDVQAATQRIEKGPAGNLDRMVVGRLVDRSREGVDWDHNSNWGPLARMAVVEDFVLLVANWQRSCLPGDYSRCPVTKEDGRTHREEAARMEVVRAPGRIGSLEYLASERESWTPPWLELEDCSRISFLDRQSLSCEAPLTSCQDNRLPILSRYDPKAPQLSTKVASESPASKVAEKEAQSDSRDREYRESKRSQSRFSPSL
jgi:hypothetical protein